MKKIFIDGEYDYDYEKVDCIHTLYYNNCEHWNEDTKGTIALQIIENNEGLKFSEEKIKRSIDYSQALHLTILLKLINVNHTFEISNKIIF